MSDKLPTAEELMLQNSGDDYTHFEEIAELMRTFAQLHVEAALKAAAENAETYEYPYMDCCSECGHTATYINRDTILNAYDKSLII